MTTQGDIGPMPDFADDEPEFPGTRASTRVGESDVVVPRARGEWRPTPSPLPYRPLPGEAWDDPSPPEPAESRAERAGDGAAGAPQASRDARGQVDQVPTAAPDFVPFVVSGRLADEVAEVSYGDPVPMLTQWFGEPGPAPVGPGVGPGSPLPARRSARRRKSAHRVQRTAETARTEVARSAPEERSAGAGRQFVAILVLGALVLAGLLYHFGWARASARADYLGFDESVLGTPTPEYVADGLRTLCRPLLAVVGGLLALRVAHPRLLIRLRRHRRIAAWFTWALRCAWFVVPGALWAATLRWPGWGARWWALLLPGGLVVGLSIGVYGVLLSRRIGAHRRGSGGGGRHWSLTAVLTAAAVVLCLFWAAGTYGRMSGRYAGKAVAHQLHRRTGVVLYSVQDLRMRPDDGVAVEEETGASYRYRYTGLRLLRRTSGTLFLLPEHWTWQRPRLLVVPEDARLRVEYERTR
ncbi:hypothetical protein [Embleya sp. AB8]|uniref:hypothetical protein n=1 Tax=Embleya sp. AB8 TaxID=3156304 RepID=UPI003C76E52E